ncbi:hypothetical protein ACA910_019894 [Epithemia clementina (nom. ined.)]
MINAQSPQARPTSSRWNVTLWLVLLTPYNCILGFSHQHSQQDVMSLSPFRKIVRVAEASWRSAASDHQRKILDLLGPGLTKSSDPINSGRRRGSNTKVDGEVMWTALDPENPVYNFLIEYYGLRGGKGPRRLARWSPCLSLLVPPLSEQANGDASFADAILLEGADFDNDISRTLHLRGAVPHTDGIIYSPGNFFGKGDPSRCDEAVKAAIPYLWYQSILQQTLTAEPVLHCHGLHEWAMQYQPVGAPPPPSAKYQAHLPLRVDQDIINQVVERKGVHCTHVDALRYFAPAAAPLNHHGFNLQRTDQLRLEQPACVHAHMDLIKISLKLLPFISSATLIKALEVALRARRLDVAASPYDCTAYGVDIVPVETNEGRAQYREEQKALMQDAELVRREVLRAYDVFLQVSFEAEVLEQANAKPDAERFAQAQPGGLPWRKNLVTRHY